MGMAHGKIVFMHSNAFRNLDFQQGDIGKKNEVLMKKQAKKSQTSKPQFKMIHTVKCYTIRIKKIKVYLYHIDCMLHTVHIETFNSKVKALEFVLSA